MVASMGLVADQTALLHGRMLPHKRPSFFRMTFKTEFVDRVGLYHFIGAGPAATAKTNYRLGGKIAHRIVAVRALQHLSSDKGFLYRMMGLFICLSPDIPMTVEAEVRLGDHQQFFHSPVDGVAAIARVACKFVSIHIPERQSLRFFVAGHAFCRLFYWAHSFAKGNNGDASASAFFDMLSTGTMTGFASFPIRGISRHGLFAMDGFHKLVVIRLMAILAGFRTHIP